MAKSLDEKLKKLRKDKDLTLQDIRETTGINEGYLSKLERGIKKNPTIDVLEKLANYFNVSVDYLLGKSNKRLPYDFFSFNKFLESNLTLDNINENKKEIKLIFRFHFGIKKPSLEMAKIVLVLNLKNQNSYEEAEKALEEKLSDDQIEQLINEIYNENNLEFNDKISVIPVLGYISAGLPLLAEEHIIRHEMIPTDQIKGGNFFYLKIRGDSMINVGIKHGDLVLVRQQPDIESNEIAVVMVNGHDATVKRVQKEADKLKLIPENDNYEPIYVQHSAAHIIGKVVALTRKF